MNILDYGAVADGKTDVTAVIQKAVDKCHEQGGGVIYIPFGTYVVASIHLYDNIHFVFESGATLLGHENPDAFDAREEISYPLYQDASHSYFHRSMFWAEDCENISFTGNGTIDMRSVWENTPTPREWEWSALRGPKIFAFKRCKDVAIKELNLLRATDLAVYTAGCERVKISGLTLDVHIDGISPDCCKDVTISDCIIRSGDDGIVLKSSYTLNEKRLCENILISNCIVTSRCSAIKMGTESNGGFKNIAISNCSIYNTYYGALAIESTDGAEIDGICVSNLVLKNVGYPIFIILSNRGRGPEGTTMGSVKNISISNLTATGPYEPWEAPQLTTLFESEKECMSEIMPSTITGQPEKKVENITLSNISVTVPGGGTEADRDIILPEVTKLSPENSNFGKTFPTYGLFVRHAKNITLSNVHIETLQDDKRDMLLFDDVENLKIID